MATTTSETPSSDPTRPKPKWPPGIPFIVGNEAAERFSFYGMKTILVVYLSELFMMFRELPTDDPERVAAGLRATHDVHLFVAGVYAFPMLGALIADRLFGKYNVIMYLSLVYCAGHAVLAIASPLHNVELFYVGLALIAIGSGGIKPCVSANVGDQFGPGNQQLVTKVYQIFYFAINFGSFFSTLLTPVLYRQFGPDVAFGVPGILMFIATVVFWMGRKKFVHVPARPGGKLGALDAFASAILATPLLAFLFGEAIGVGWLEWFVIFVVCGGVWYGLFRYRNRLEQDDGFFAIVDYCMRNQKDRKKGQGFFDVAREKFGDEAAEGPQAVLKIAVVFSAVSMFWALFDQHASSWVLQAQRMELPVLPAWVPGIGGTTMDAAQIGALNPVMVMMIIPLMNIAVYPVIEKLGIETTPLRRMTVGMFLASSAFVVVAITQTWVEAGEQSGELVSVYWQIIPYWIMTTAEVLVSVTGLEFAYTQAPRRMKSTIMSFWLLTVAFGNKFVAVLAAFEGMEPALLFWIFAGLMAAAATLFMILAYFYKGKSYLQGDAEPAVDPTPAEA